MLIVSISGIKQVFLKNWVKFGDAQYFIIAEQDVLTEVHSMTDTIYLLFITHYVFQIKYEKALTNVGLFFHDNIFQLNDNTGHTPKYNSIIGNIRQLVGQY